MLTIKDTAALSHQELIDLLTIIVSNMNDDGTIEIGKISTTILANSSNKFYVDGSRTDTYTETGSILTPYKTILGAITAIQILANAQIALGTQVAYDTTRYTIEVAPGIYSDNLTIGNMKYLGIKLNGATISGTILNATTMVGGAVSDYYSKLEFIGSPSSRAYRGRCGLISGVMTFTRNNDSLHYVNFTGVEVSNNVQFGTPTADTDGTFVVGLQNAYFSGSAKFISGYFTGASSNILIEAFSYNKILAHIAKQDGSATRASLYDCRDTYFDLINITPYENPTVKNCTFNSTTSIVASKTLSIDANSYKSLLAQSPTLTGMTISHLDYVNPTVLKEYFVDGNRTDSYTATGSIFAPFKTILAAITAINADSTIQQAVDPATYALQARYILNVAPGIYSDNLTIGNVKYLRINLNGAEISGNIAYDTTMVGGTADQYYSKLEFFGGNGIRAEKGNSGRITGTITGTRNNDSLTYVSFSGIDLVGNVKFTTQGTWVVHLHNTRVGAFFEGSSLNGGLVLLETTGWVEFTSAGHIANSADGSATTVSIYRAQNAEFDLINITPLTESIFYNCKFKSNVTITAQTIYIDANSYKSLLAQTETLTGATVSLMDDFLPAASAQEEIAGNVGGAISITKFLTFISSDAGGDAFTLAAGTAIRQQKKIIFRTDGGGDAVVTGAFAGAATTLTFNDAGECALLEWNGTDWIALELGSVIDLTNAPVIA